MKPITMDDFEFFEEVQPDISQKKRDEVSKLISSLKRDDNFKIGKDRWRIQYANGGTIYMTKHGSSGKKLYTLFVESLIPAVFSVHEVTPGSATYIRTVATGELSDIKHA